MNTQGLVELAVYDLSHGMARSYLSSFLGIEVEAIYHTGVRVYGYEIFYSEVINFRKSVYFILICTSIGSGSKITDSDIVKA